jgi:hypothetical protein
MGKHFGKTRKLKSKREKKTRGKRTRKRKRGGGLLGSIVGLRNIKYINLLENRLVNKCGDYEWVQQQRVSSMRMKRDRKDYK